jgi:hypothetical protein
VDTSNQIAEQLLHAFSLQPPLFEEAAKTSAMTEEGEKERHFKMRMAPCGIGLDNVTRHVHKFTRRAESLEIPDDQGSAHFSLFRMLLTDAAPKAGWQEVTKGTDQDPKALACFIKVGKAWITRVSVPSDRDKQILWMRTVAKGPGVPTKVFDSNLCLTDALADWWLLRTNAILTEEELKTTFVNGMPATWKTACHSAGKNCQVKTHTLILACMRGSERESDLKAKPNAFKQQCQQRNSSSNHSKRSNCDGGRNLSSRG